MVALQKRKEIGCYSIEEHRIIIRRACHIFSISVICYYHKSIATDENKQIVDLLIKPTDENRSWGLGLCFLTLRNVMELPYKHKRMYHIYCDA